MADGASHEHGWSPVLRSLDKLVAERNNPAESTPIRVEDIKLPDSSLATQVYQYAQEKLPAQTFNHSMRVFYYGTAIATQHFPSWRFSSETYLLACLLHDIGTTPENQGSIRLSFEFQGGYISLDLLKSLHAEIQHAELVAETIIRHQDLGNTGNITVLTAIIHFAIVLDSAGLHPGLVHGDTVRSVVGRFPRNKWTGCFASSVRKECELKPWANTTRIDGFAEMIEANKLMEPYD